MRAVGTPGQALRNKKLRRKIEKRRDAFRKAERACVHVAIRDVRYLKHFGLRQRARAGGAEIDDEIGGMIVQRFQSAHARFDRADADDDGLNQGPERRAIFRLGRHQEEDAQRTVGGGVGLEHQRMSPESRSSAASSVSSFFEKQTRTTLVTGLSA